MNGSRPAIGDEIWGAEPNDCGFDFPLVLAAVVYLAGIFGAIIVGCAQKSLIDALVVFFAGFLVATVILVLELKVFRALKNRKKKGK